MNHVTVLGGNSHSDSEVIGLMIRHDAALSTEDDRPAVLIDMNWIVDSGATCHLCNDSHQFAELVDLPKSMEITLGDGHVITAQKCGTVDLAVFSPDG